MKKLVLISLGFFILLTGCATGPKYLEVKDTIPSLNYEYGRMYFYRTSVLGAAIQPQILVNGASVGKAVPGGFFYVDRPPGEYEVITTTEVERELSFILEEGQTRYIRLDISMGFFVGHIYPNLIEPEVAKEEITKCSYVENKTEN